MVSDDDDDVVLQVQPQQQAGPSQSVIVRQVVPPYGQRRGWKPASLEDFGAWFKLGSVRHLILVAGDGGAYPECHIAQYPLNMGKKKASVLHISLAMSVIDLR